MDYEAEAEQLRADFRNHHSPAMRTLRRIADARQRRVEAPETRCPRCGEWLEDFDGFGVLCHESCGYCSHASVDGGVCSLCGKRVEVEALTA